ncbi:hypothetical protein G7Y89_g6438 [Cudoniella acicularis]|uniref:ABC transporter domain-containing protein n=1 Tax=Cudoniella acicularis TaxID=354080 RepID=A0A8H4W2F5_9HELO|nr:hypothetical protein G7Y89_g6438 [Cudoniella acicularis]
MTEHAENCTYVNFTKDIIRLSDSILPYLGKAELEGIQSMILDTKDVAYLGHYHMEILKNMKNLKEVKILVEEGVVYGFARSSRYFQSLTRDFEDARTADPGWEGPKVKIISVKTGEQATPNQKKPSTKLPGPSKFKHEEASLSTERPQMQRIYRQTVTLIYKNFLIFYKAPIATTLRALIFPIAVTLVFSLLKSLQSTSEYYDEGNDFAIAPSASPIKSLADAMTSASSEKIVFVRNGIPVDTFDPIVNGILQEPRMSAMQTYSVDDPNDLFDLCQQTIDGISDCFAAVVFQVSNETTVQYIIALDKNELTYGQGNYRTGDTKYANVIAPIQYTVNSHVGGFSTAPKPSTQSYGGYDDEIASQPPPVHAEFWLQTVGLFVGPVFILILIGVVYHLATFVALERETSIAELMAAQKVSITPRILSTFISFFALYFPGFLISSILLTQILFTRTSTILMIFLTLLAGASLIAWSHFLASFFGKAQLAGLYCSTFVFAKSLVTLAASLTNANVQPRVTALAAIFPPMAWATLIGDVATREYYLRGFSLAPNSTNYIMIDGEEVKYQFMNGYLYVIFFILQIIVFSLATYAVENWLWGVERKFDTIDASSDVAVRCTALSKTYYGKRRWYFPFFRKGGPVLAVNSLNLEVKKGSVTFLLGPNGGGKTTTLKCVAGMQSMDAGSRLELNEGGLIFGICPQSNVFWANLTVQEHVKIWRKLKTAAFEDLSIDDDDVIAECDLLEKTDACAKNLSGGQMRKLQLAISFVGGSKVCCIDEASSGLDPLSRRNIWNIIQKGHARRTILVTTHFLDEADVLADHIAIVYKGKLVCEGPGTSLKARFGEDYLIRSNDESDADNLVWRATNSAEATKKVLELEAISEDNTFDVTFPTLEQVFLRVTSESNTAIRENGGDGIVGEEDNSATIDEKILDIEQDNVSDIDLDVGHSIGLARQILALFQKRYVLLTQKAGWISYGINLIIPIIIAAAISKFIPGFGALQTCQTNNLILRNASSPDRQYPYQTLYPLFGAEPGNIISHDNFPSTLLGPTSQFSNAAQNAIYASSIGPFFETYSYKSTSTNTSLIDSILNTRAFVDTSDQITAQIANLSHSSSLNWAIFSPTPETSVFYYDAEEEPFVVSQDLIGFDLLTNRIANATTTTGTAKNTVTSLRLMRSAVSTDKMYSLPISALVVLGFIAAASVAVIYPTFEKVNNVRALQYCNGVSPFALWAGYLLFDLQFILIQSIVVWACLFAGAAATFWYEPNYILGAFILFGIATYLGTYLMSLYFRKAAYAIAAGVHVLLFVLYIVAYVVNQSVGSAQSIHETYNTLQYVFGLSSPAANILRAFWVAGNNYDVLCGKYGVADTSNPFAYVRYGSVYTNLIIQIVFLVTILVIYEYGSADWVRRNITNRAVPARLHYTVESGNPIEMAEKNATATSTGDRSQVLNVSKVSKFFGKLFAVENVSFDIAANEILALLGGNGAGKTTVINMIRGELKPNFGTIQLDGISVQKEPHKARLQMGVCPQDDAIDNLTVRQTLNFYATVKGLKNVSGNVDKVIRALNISIYQDLPVKALSGGTRRKLSVAIALLGNPRVLLLDEPSTGQDAGAKRILWKALRDVSANRAILLTTHSMEEAEALATNVAIMGTKMLAKGTLSSLQASYGGGND